MLGWRVRVMLILAIVGSLISACSGKSDDRNALRSSDTTDPLNRSCNLGECEPVGQRVTAASSPVCPALEPSVALPCAVEGLSCTYGSSVAAYCRRYYEWGEDIWRMPQALNAGCLSHPAGYCPPEPEPEPEGGCTVGDDPTLIPCEYPRGIGCYCEGNPQRPGAPGQWKCYGPPRNGACPELLPNLGDGCASNGQFCSYGYVQGSLLCTIRRCVLLPGSLGRGGRGGMPGVTLLAAS
jgi:hypothetical protein